MNPEDLVEYDPLTPYVLLSASAAGISLYDPYAARPTDSYLRQAVGRHLTLLSRTLTTHHYRPSALQDMMDLANHLIARAQRSSDPLERFLAYRRAELPALVTSVTPSLESRSAKTWSQIRADRSLSRGFDEHMVKRATTADVFPASMFDQATGIVADVGGGPGHYLARALTSAGQSWTGILCETYDDAGWLILGCTKLAPRVRKQVIPQEMTPTPPAAHLYILGSMLHDMPDSQATALLKSISRSASSNAKIVVIERTFDQLDLRDSARDLDMQILFGGRERSQEEYYKLLEAAGFQGCVGTCTADRYQVLTAHKGVL